MRLGGWGSFPLHETHLSAPRSEAALRERVAEGGLIARGNGRAYGDSAVGGRTVQTRHLDRMLAFDASTGQLVAAFPRYHPWWAWWLTRVPGLREFAVSNLVLVLRA